MKAVMRESCMGDITLCVKFTHEDLNDVRLDAIDRAQLAEKPKSVSDWLLDAELIARRIEQHQKRLEAARPLRDNQGATDGSFRPPTSEPK